MIKLWSWLHFGTRLGVFVLTSYLDYFSFPLKPSPVTSASIWTTFWASRPLVDAITSNTPWQNAMTVSTMVRFMTMKSSTEIRGWCLVLHVVWPKDLLTMWANGAKMSPLMILIAQDFVLFSRKRWVLQLRQKNIFPRLARECNPLRFSLFFGILCWRDDRHVLARFV